MARMRFEIVMSPEAVGDLGRLNARARAETKDGIETHLRNEPAKTSKSRIKKLLGLKRPQYRLRIDEIRVFYDIEGAEVRVLAIIPKSEALKWLEQAGEKS